MRRLFAAARELLFPEGLAVGTLIHSRICLMSTYHNSIQRAVVLILTVVGTLLYGAFDALVGIAAHNFDLLFLSSPLV